MKKITALPLFALFLSLLTAASIFTGCPDSSDDDGNNNNGKTAIKLALDISQLSTETQDLVTGVGIKVAGDTVDPTSQSLDTNTGVSYTDEVDAEFVNSVMEYTYKPSKTKGKLQFYIDLLDDSNNVLASASFLVDIQAGKQVDSAVVFQPTITPGCTKAPSLTITNNAKEPIIVRVYKQATQEEVLSYNLPYLSTQTDSLALDTYIVTAVGLNSGVALLSVSKVMTCGSAYSMEVQEDPTPPDQFYNVDVHNQTGNVVYVCYNSTNPADGAPLANGLTSTTQFAVGTGATLRIFNFKGDQIFAVKFGSMAPGFTQNYSADGLIPSLQFQNHLNLGATPPNEAVVVFLDGEQINFEGDPILLPGYVKNYLLPYAGEFDIMVQGLDSGTIYVDLKKQLYTGDGITAVPINP